MNTRVETPVFPKPRGSAAMNSGAPSRSLREWVCVVLAGALVSCGSSHPSLGAGSGGSSGTGAATTGPSGTQGGTSGASTPSDTGTSSDTSTTSGTHTASGTSGSTASGGTGDASATGTGDGGTGNTSGSTGTSTGDGGAMHWVGTWTGAPQLTETANLPPSPLTGAALRQVVHVSIGGSQVRVRFSNEFGDGPLTMNEVHIAVSPDNPDDSKIDTATDTALTFSGTAAVTIPMGQHVWSDPVNFSLAPLSSLAVTTAFGTVPTDVTGHPGSRTTSYEQTGSTVVNAASMTSAQTVQHWYVLDGLDVMASASTQGIVVLGDSISDGRGSDTDGNDRWPDDLAVRLHGNAATANVAVMNQGIGGNAVVTGGLGPTASSRFSRDVLEQDGVRWVIILEGVNDLGAQTSATQITGDFGQMISAAHAQNLLVYASPITPFAGTTDYAPTTDVQMEPGRTAVNTYIMSGVFDGVIDLSTPVSNGANPPALQTMFDSGDHLHPNAAGYHAMANSIDLTLFTK